MGLVKTLWRRILANGLLALALVLSHSLPLPVLAEASVPHASHEQMIHAMHGHDHPAPVHKSMPAAANCQACPGMALLLPEALQMPLRVSFCAYPPLSSEQAEGRSPGLDTPPPKNSLDV